jgi:hypothetical protein
MNNGIIVFLGMEKLQDKRERNQTVYHTLVGRGALNPVGEGYRSLKSNRD